MEKLTELDKYNKKAKGILHNVLQAYRVLTKNKKDVVLVCVYPNRTERHTFISSNFKDAKFFRYLGFKHKVDCIRRDFKEISTYYKGNKSDCKFYWILKEKLPA